MINNNSMLTTYEEFIDAIKQTIAGRIDVVMESSRRLRYQTKLGIKEYPYIKVSSASILATDKIMIIRAGLHGDEVGGVFTLMKYIGDIFSYAHARRVKLVIFPLDNPSGFFAGTRYNIEGDNGDFGNNDFLRYKLADGRVVGDLGARNEYREWKWSTEPEFTAHLPQETLALHAELKRLPLEQVVGALDLHSDNFIVISATYQYGFGDFTVYQDIVAKVRSIISKAGGRLLANENVDSDQLSVPGFTSEIVHNGQVIIDSFVPWSNSQGFIVRHDGSFSDLFYRLGAKYSVTVEITKVTPERVADEINLAWIRGTIDLIVR